MWLEYHFKDIMREVEVDGGINEPNLVKKLCEVDYDYEVSISEEDLVGYLALTNTKELSQDFQVGFKTGIGHAINADLIKFNDLELDEYFIRFMTEKYREKAYEKCVDENA